MPNQFLNTLFVTLGAVLGSNIRFIIYERFKKLNFSKEFSILIINIFSCFCLGLFISILPRIDSYAFSDQLILFISIGLLGSLSTFSTFICDLFNAFFRLQFFSAFKLFFISLILGIISVAFGLVLANQ